MLIMKTFENEYIEFQVNVFDTPGFADSDPENIKKNKLLIASAITNDIHMIIFLTSNARFDAGNQDALEMLNEWTAGKMWNNLLVVKVDLIL